VCGRRFGLQTENCLHHPLHLLLLGAAVTADSLLDTRGRILSARDAGARARHQHGSARLSDGERGTGVDADERLLEGDGIGGVLRDEPVDPVEDRSEPQFRAHVGRGRPPPVVDSPEAPVFFVDDAVSARSRTGVDPDDLHTATLGGTSDDSSPSSLCHKSYISMVFNREIWRQGLYAAAEAHPAPDPPKGATPGP